MKRALLMLSSLCVASVVSVAGEADQFYEGKTVTVLVGTAPGGGYDAYARILSRHMGKYVPGNPNIIVANMPGASGMVVANYVYNVAPPDGLIFGGVHRQIPFAPLLGNTAAQYDGQKFSWIGTSSSFRNDASFFFVRKNLGLTTVEDIRAFGRPLQFGVSGRTSVGYEGARIIGSVLGMDINIITGYPGSAQTQLALESGELDAMILGMSSLGSQKPEWLEPNNDVSFIVQFGYGDEGRHPRFPDVPRIDELVRTEEDKGLFFLFQVPFRLAFPYAAPPGLPADRLKVLREAFMQTHNDAAYLQESKKVNMDISPRSGEEVSETIAQAYGLSPDLVARYIKILSE